MKILSLYDGHSCCQTALKNLGIKIDTYYASEIDKNAIKVTQYNHPNTIQIGDITKVDLFDRKYFGVDLLSGGSPCQNFSFAGKRNGLTVKDVEILTLEHYLQLKEDNFEFEGTSWLFWEFVNTLCIVKPKYFFLENVVMSKKWEEIITNVLGVEPLKVNSDKFSGQRRARLYWTNIPVNETDLLSKESSVTVRDILDIHSDDFYLPGIFYPLQTTGRSSSIGLGGLVVEGKSTWVDNPSSISHFRQGQRVYSLDGKSTTLVTSNQTIYDFGEGNYRRLNIKEMERLQGYPDDYTNVPGVSKGARVKGIGNAWNVPTIEFLFQNLKHLTS